MHYILVVARGNEVEASIITEAELPDTPREGEVERHNILVAPCFEGVPGATEELCAVAVEAFKAGRRNSTRRWAGLMSEGARHIGGSRGGARHR